MFRKLLVLALACMLLNLCCVAPVAASGKTQDQDAKKIAKQAKKIRGIINRLGAGRDSQLELVMRDQTELKGYVSSIGEDHFVLADLQTGATTNVLYAQVEKVKYASLFKSALRKETLGGFAQKMAIGTGLFFGAVLLICAASKRCQE